MCSWENCSDLLPIFILDCLLSCRVSSLYILDINLLWKCSGSPSVVSTLCDPMACIPLSSYICGILQARIVEWVAIPFSKGSSWPRDQTQVSLIAARFFTFWAIREAFIRYMIYKFFSHSGLAFLLCWGFPLLFKNLLAWCCPRCLISFLLLLLLVLCKKSSLKTYVKDLAPKVSFRSFMVSGLTFKSSIHFELIFVYALW